MVLGYNKVRPSVTCETHEQTRSETIWRLSDLELRSDSISVCDQYLGNINSEKNYIFAFPRQSYIYLMACLVVYERNLTSKIHAISVLVVLESEDMSSQTTPVTNLRVPRPKPLQI